MPMSRWNGMLVVALLPLWILVAELVATPSAVDGLGSNPPAFVGLPAGFLLVAAALAAMTIGVVVLRRARSTAVTLAALLGLTLPAAAVVATAPFLLTLLELTST